MAGEYIKVSVYNPKNIGVIILIISTSRGMFCKKAFFHLRNITKNTLNGFYQDESEILFHAFISPKLDQFAMHFSLLLPPPQGRQNPEEESWQLARLYGKILTVETYSQHKKKKISICLIIGLTEYLRNDDVSIVHSRK